jgi:uncharacterized protein involved in outer membrane biogenesis
VIPYGGFFTRHWRRMLVWSASALAVFTLVGFFVIPPIVKSVLAKQLTAALHRDVSIQEVRFNPFALSLTVRGLAVKEPKGTETFASLEELYVNLESYSLFRWAVVVQEFRLTKPFLRVVRRQDESYNFSDLLQGQEAKPTEPTKPPRFSVNNIHIVDGSVDFLDELAGKKHTVRAANLGIPWISSIPSNVEIFVEPGVSVQINGTHYAIKGKTKPFADSQETTLDIDIADLDLPFYLAYVPRELLTFAMPSGKLDAKLGVVFVRPKKGDQTLTVKGDVGLRELAIDDKQGNPVVRIPTLGIGLASIEPLTRKAHLSTISLQAPELTVRRDKTGITNLETMLPKQPPAKQATPTAPASAPAEESLVLDVDAISIAGAKLFISDLMPSRPFKTTVAPIDLAVKQLSNRPDAKGTYTLTMRTEAQEDLALEGSVSLTPLSVEGAIEGKAVLLKKYAPYYADSVLFDIEGGKLDFSSRYRYAQGKTEPEIAASEAAATLSGLRLKRRDAKEDFLRIPLVTVKDTTADVTQRQITVGSVATQKGTLSAVRLPNGEVDLQQLVPPPPAAAKPAAAAAPAEAKPWVITLKRLTVDQYAVKLEDRAAAEPITLAVEKIRVTADDITTAKNKTGKLGLSLLMDQSVTVNLNTAVGLDPLRADGKLEVSGVVLKRYAPYYKEMVPWDAQDGVLDLATNYRVTQTKDAFDVKLAGLTTSVKALRLTTRDTKEEFLSIPSLAVKNTAVDLLQQDVVVGDFSTEGGTVLVSRSHEGEISLMKLLPRVGAAAATLAGAPAPGQPVEAPAPAQPARPWTVKAESLSVNQYRIQARDEVPSDPVSVVVEELNLKAENISLAENAPAGKAALRFRLDKGTVATEGTLSVAPIVADMKVEAKEIDIRPFQPYIADRVKATIADGRASTSGRLELSIKEPGGLQAKYAGEVGLGKFSAVEKDSAEDLLKWESLSMTGLSVGVNPLSVRAQKVALADFFAHVVIQPDGRLNLQEVLAAPAPEKPADQSKPSPPPGPPAQPAKPDGSAPPPAAAAMDIQIVETTMQGGHVQLLDRSVRPNFTAEMTEIGGRVSGLSSEETSLADVELRGKMGRSAPLEIVGKVNPLKRDLFADIQARFTGMDLSPTSPYAGKFAGYTIEKGKLSFDLKYLIDKRKLSSENKVFVDQFTFGEKVDSPTATNLPVKLAVALLKDRNGQIRLDIPVSGSIDDPQFDIWSVVWQIIGNLITKAITSPFALLGSAFGGGEELQYLEFDYGRSTLAEDGAKKLDALVGALADKPGLNLEITGHADPEADREGLKQYLLQRKVKAQKLPDLVKKGSPAVPVDDIVVSPEEYEKYLTLAYEAEKFPKPRNFIGLEKGLPVPEMEKLILTHIEVGDEELRQLAAQRATAVQEAMIRSGKVGAERLFIVEPKTLAPEKKDKVKDSRVDFKIG